MKNIVLILFVLIATFGCNSVTTEESEPVKETGHLIKRCEYHNGGYAENDHFLFIDSDNNLYHYEGSNLPYVLSLLREGDSIYVKDVRPYKFRPAFKR